MSKTTLSPALKAAGIKSVDVATISKVLGVAYNDAMAQANEALESIGGGCTLQDIIDYLKPRPKTDGVTVQTPGLPEQAATKASSESGYGNIPEEDEASEWGEIDLGGDVSDLPPAGEYNATICAVDLNDLGDALYYKLGIQLDDFPDYDLEEFQTLAGRAGTDAEKRAKQGRQVLYQIRAATGINVGGNPFDLPCKLEDARVRVKVAHKKKDGEYDLVIRRYTPVSKR